MIEHIVQSGETLYILAKQYNISIQAIIDANNLANPDVLAVGQKLIIPVQAVKPTLRRGDRGTAVTELQSRLLSFGYNPGPIDGIFGGLTETAVRHFQENKGLSADGIVGSKTWAALSEVMPGPEPGVSQPPAEAVIHTVQAGDTLWKLSLQYDTTIQKIIDENNLDPAKYLYIGQKLTIPAPAAVVYGNTSGNWMNGSSVAFDGQFIYFSRQSDGFKIYRVKPDGSEMSRVSSIFGASLNVIGDWVYFVGGPPNLGIYKVKTDGTSQTKISTDSPYFIAVAGEWIYYLQTVGEGGIRELYKIKTDGSSKTKISLNDNLAISDASEFIVLGGWIYISVYNKSESMSQLFRIKTDGSEANKLVSPSMAHYAIENGWIYFIPGDAKDEIRKVKIDGTGMTTIYKTSTPGFSLYSLNISADKIYFSADNQSATEEYPGIYSINLDGSGFVKLTNTVANHISIASDWIYFEDRKIKTDGSQESIIP